MTFQELNIMPAILRSLRDENYSKPTPIQAQAIPPIIEGRDLLGIAQTGTGKTAAFAVPILQNLDKGQPVRAMSDARGHVRALILTPTRELALQIYESLCAYGSNTRLRVSVIFGGVSQRPQEQALVRGVDVLVATPGRLKDLMNQGLVRLGGVEILTLDEADRMLDMGFSHDVKYIIAQTPKERQTLFFSATMPQEIVQLSRSILRDPVRVSITPDSPTVDKISQSLYMVNKKSKFKLLEHLLKSGAGAAGAVAGVRADAAAGVCSGVRAGVDGLSSVLVFTRTKHGADRVVRDLGRSGISAQAIHGNKSQNARQLALSNFKNRKIRVLVATDIAARGIDIDELSLVINYDLPEVPESYVHRIGRTGRAGHDGVAISFCDVEEMKALRDIERLCGRSIPRVDGHPFVPGSEPVVAASMSGTDGVIATAVSEFNDRDARRSGRNGGSRGERGTTRANSRGASHSQGTAVRSERPGERGQRPAVARNTDQAGRRSTQGSTQRASGNVDRVSNRGASQRSAGGTGVGAGVGRSSGSRPVSSSRRTPNTSSAVRNRPVERVSI